MPRCVIRASPDLEAKANRFSTDCLAYQRVPSKSQLYLGVPEHLLHQDRQPVYPRTAPPRERFVTAFQEQTDDHT